MPPELPDSALRMVGSDADAIVFRVRTKHPAFLWWIARSVIFVAREQGLPWWHWRVLWTLFRALSAVVFS